MNQSTLKTLIYNQLYCGANYELIASIAPNQTIKNILFNFASDCKNNATYLNYLYRQVNVAGFDPIIKQPEFHGSFVESLHWLLDFLIKSLRAFYIYAFDQNNTSKQREILLFITCILNEHIARITTLAIIKTK